MKIEKKDFRIYVTGNIKTKEDTEKIIRALEEEGREKYIELHLGSSISASAWLLIYLRNRAKEDNNVVLYVGNNLLYNFLKRAGLTDKLKIKH